MSVFSPILERAAILADGAAARWDDAWSWFLQVGPRAASDRHKPVTRTGGFQMPLARLAPSDVFVARLPAPVRDPIDAANLMRINEPRLNPLGPDDTVAAIARTPNGDCAAAFVRTQTLDALRRADALEHVTGFVFAAEDARTAVFRSEVERRRWRVIWWRRAALICLVSVSVVAVALAFQVRADRTLEQARNDRSRVMAELDALTERLDPAQAEPNIAAVTLAQTIEILDQIARARPPEWQFLTWRQTSDSLLVQFEADVFDPSQATDLETALSEYASMEDVSISVARGSGRLQRVDITLRLREMAR